jgi:hypothetical protein
MRIKAPGVKNFLILAEVKGSRLRLPIFLSSSSLERPFFSWCEVGGLEGRWQKQHNFLPHCYAHPPSSVPDEHHQQKEESILMKEKEASHGWKEKDWVSQQCMKASK